MTINFEPKAKKQLSKLDAITQKRINKGIDTLNQWPNVQNIRALDGKYNGLYRLRVGEKRVIFDVVERNLIVIIKVGDRREIYN